MPFLNQESQDKTLQISNLWHEMWFSMYLSYSGTLVFLVQRALKALQRLQGNVHPLLLPITLHLLFSLCKPPDFQGFLSLCVCFWNPACVFLQGIVSLCLQFECLLQTYLPQLFYHLRQLGAQPWVHAAPSSHLQLILHPLVWQILFPFKMLFTSTMSVIVCTLRHASWSITPVFS